jgi:glycosyltransferase involved in cell wall biosynthesis
MSPPRLEISIVVPVYDEEESLPQLHAELCEHVGGMGVPWEVLYTDDHSTDGSLAVLLELRAADPRVRVLSLARNYGQTAAMAAGFEHSRGRVVVTLDADLQNDPVDIPRLLAALEGWDVVCGVRARRRDTWLRRVSSRIANAVRNRATGEAVTDVGCTLRVYRREVVAAVPMFTGMHRFLPTLLRLGGARIRELPVGHRPRLHGRAKYGVHNRLWRGIVDLVAVRWMQRRWIDPRIVEEVTPWRTRPSGSGSASEARVSSSPASSSSGSPPSAGAGA